MQLRLFTLRFNPLTEAFDDSAVRAFLADKEVLSIRDHFFVKDDTPYLTLIIRYRGAALPEPAEAEKPKPKHSEDWRKRLSEADWPLFNTLREWRTERGKQQGIPPYVICNNQQLAQVVKARPTTLAALGAIEGFGEAKLKKYGQELLTLIAGEPPPEPEPGDARD